MKLTEFARVFKVSERHARRLFSENQADIDGHYYRDGRKGTELDDFAVEYLKGKLQKPFDVVTVGGSNKERALEDQLKKLLVEYAETSKKLADAERRAGEGAGAVALLAAAKEQQDELKGRVEQAEARADKADRERREAEDRARARELELEEKAKDLQKQLDNEIQRNRDLRNTPLLQRIFRWKK